MENFAFRSLFSELAMSKERVVLGVRELFRPVARPSSTVVHMAICNTSLPSNEGPCSLGSLTDRRPRRPPPAAPLLVVLSRSEAIRHLSDWTPRARRVHGRPKPNRFPMARSTELDVNITKQSSVPPNKAYTHRYQLNME